MSSASFANCANTSSLISSFDFFTATSVLLQSVRGDRWDTEKTIIDQNQLPAPFGKEHNTKSSFPQLGLHFELTSRNSHVSHIQQHFHKRGMTPNSPVIDHFGFHALRRLIVGFGFDDGGLVGLRNRVVARFNPLIRVQFEISTVIPIRSLPHEEHPQHNDQTKDDQSAHNSSDQWAFRRNKSWVTTTTTTTTTYGEQSEWLPIPSIQWNNSNYPMNLIHYRLKK